MAIENRSASYRIRTVDGLPIIESERLIMMIATSDQVGQIVRYLRRNREHLRPWEPLRKEEYFTEDAWRTAPERDQAEARRGDAYRLRMLLKPNLDWNFPQGWIEKGEFIGTISLRNINPWPGFHGTIGYSLDKDWERRGLMREGVAATVHFAFEQLNLRRIEACYMPTNVRSARLLDDLGFKVEGLLRSSMEVDGKWEDHHICSIINHNWLRK